jgi:hypothetical protein
MEQGDAMNNVSKAMLARIAELEHLDMLKHPMTPSETREWQELLFIMENDDPMTEGEAEMLLKLYMSLVPPKLRW